MHRVSCAVFVFWLQVILAIYQIQAPELEFLSNNLRPIECMRFYKLIRRQSPTNTQDQPQEPHKPDCKKLLSSWLSNPKNQITKGRDTLKIILRSIGRADLAQWLGYNTIHQRKLASPEPEKGYREDRRRNMAVRYKGDDHLVRGSATAKLTSEAASAKTSSTQTVLQKIFITTVVILSMTTLCLCCYKFLYERMSGGHFANFRNEVDEESWLQQDRRQSGGGSRGSCCTRSSITMRKPWWNSMDSLKLQPFSVVEYLKKKIKGHEDYSRNKRSRQLKALITRLEKTCPTQKKVIKLNRGEQNLLKSLTEAERRQLPATDSDLKFLLSSDREKRRLLAHEGRREFLIELRKRLERMGAEGKKNLTLNETERKCVRKLSSSERLLLPIMDADLELLVSNPLEKRQVMLRQLCHKFSGISPEDRKYLELETGEKKFLKELDEKEKKKLGITDSEFRFLVASVSQRNVMQQRLAYCKRDQRVKDIRKRLAEVNYDVSCLQLSEIEHSSFLSLNSYELARLGLTQEHVKFYAASDSERKIMWPSPSQHRNLRLNTLQTKLSKLPWKDCSTRLTRSEHTLLASLTPREQDKLHISDSEKNFMLSTDSQKELIQRQRNIQRLETKIRDFNTVTMTESERGLILSLSPSEMQMLNIDSTNRSTLLEKKPRDAIDRELRAKIESVKERIHNEGLSNVRLTNSERRMIESLSNFEADSCGLTPSQLSFLLTMESERKMKSPRHRHQSSTQCSEAQARRCVSSRDLRTNTSSHVCDHHEQLREPERVRMQHQESRHVHQCIESQTTHCASSDDVQKRTSPRGCDLKASNCRIHSHSKDMEYADQENRSHSPEHRHKVQFKEPETYNASSNTFDGEGPSTLITRELSSDDSELSETYDELGMLFSQQMKQQARPCQRKYCLLGRHLKKGSNHDERQCQMRHYCCRGYPSDQRPSCSSGNVCKDTYDEYELMHARPKEVKQLNSSMFERRKQFLDLPCKKCSLKHDNYTKNNQTG